MWPYQNNVVEDTIDGLMRQAILLYFSPYYVLGNLDSWTQDFYDIASLTQKQLLFPFQTFPFYPTQNLC